MAPNLISGNAQAQISEDDFYEWMSSLNNIMHQRYEARDIDGMYRILDRYIAMNAMARKDPLLSILETATTQLFIRLADSHLDDLRFDNCIGMLKLAFEVLLQKSSRYRNYGKPPPPDSICWANLISTLADVKWKGPVELRDAVLPVDKMVFRYFLAEERIRRSLRNVPRSAEKTANLLDSLAWCGCFSAMMLMRFAPESLDDFFYRFERYHGDILVNQDLPFYWNLAISRMFLSGTIDRNKLSHYYFALRDAATHLSSEQRNPPAFLHSTANEERYLSRLCRRNLILLER